MRRRVLGPGWVVGLLGVLVLAACDPGDDGTNHDADAPDEMVEEPVEGLDPDVPGVDDGLAPDAVEVDTDFVTDPDCFGIEPIELEPDDVECGMVSVPLHYDDPDGERIEIAVALLAGSDPERYDQPLLMLGGGPGEVVVEPSLTQPLVRDLLDIGPDLIMIDQRGVGSGNPSLGCEETADLDLGDTTEEGLESGIAALEACHARLVDDGIDLDAFNHLANARDIDLVRVALGHDQIDVRGTSYGTQVALLAAELHPDTIRSVTLSSPVDPTINWVEQVGAGMEQAIDRVIGACALDEECSEQIGDLREAIQSTVDRLEGEPEEVTVQPQGGDEVTRTYRPSTYLDNLLALFYVPNGTALLPVLIDLARDGQLEPLAQIAAVLEQALEEGLTTGMQFSMLCSAEAALVDPEASVANLNTSLFEKYWFESSILGGEVSGAVCDVWDVALAYDPAEVSLTSEIPTLIFTGTFDHVTRPEWGEQVHEALPTSHLIEVPTAGHGPLETLGPCGQQIVAAFLADPAETPDDRCATEQHVQFITQLPPGLG